MTMKNELAPARAFLKKRFPQGARVLCAVSGGLDSMCLLDFMARQEDFSVIAAHFNHRLRGENADRDEQFVRDVCAARGIPFVSGDGDTRALAEREVLTVEEAARRLRYAFLEQMARSYRCGAILTAHHADDNAETMLLNLARGTGSAGLAGIPPARGNVCRPFLQITRAELQAYAAAHDIPHVEDETNTDPDAAARNLLRQSVIPVLRQLNPRFAENMARTASILQAENEALEVLAKDLADQAGELPEGVTIPCMLLTEAPEAVAERTVLRLMAQAAGHRKDLTAAHVTAVLDLARGNRTDLEVSLPYGLTARRKKYSLELTRRALRPVPVALALNASADFGGVRVRVSDRPEPEALPMWLPEGAVMAVTSWRPGDRLRLPGSRGSRSFKRLCADRGLTPEERDLLPVLRVGDAPAADPLFGVHADFAPRSGERTVYVRFYKKTEEKHHEK